MNEREADRHYERAEELRREIMRTPQFTFESALGLASGWVRETLAGYLLEAPGVAPPVVVPLKDAVEALDKGETEKLTGFLRSRAENVWWADQSNWREKLSEIADVIESQQYQNS